MLGTPLVVSAFLLSLVWGRLGMHTSERQTYTVRETAAVMGLSLGATYELLRQGRLTGLRLGKRWVVPRVQLDAFLASASDRG